MMPVRTKPMQPDELKTAIASLAEVDTIYENSPEFIPRSSWSDLKAGSIPAPSLNAFPKKRYEKRGAKYYISYFAPLFMPQEN